MSMSNTTKRVREIRRKTRRKFSSEEKIRIVLEGLRGEDSIAELRSRRVAIPMGQSCLASLLVFLRGGQPHGRRSVV
jgi:transposase-like protein